MNIKAVIFVLIATITNAGLFNPSKTISDIMKKSSLLNYGRINSYRFQRSPVIDDDRYRYNPRFIPTIYRHIR